MACFALVLVLALVLALVLDLVLAGEMLNAFG